MPNKTFLHIESARQMPNKVFLYIK